MLAGTIGGVVYAQTGSGDNARTANVTALFDKVASIYQQNTGVAIDSQELQKAFSQAGSELRSQAMDKYIQGLVDQGKLTQKQADDYKAWLKSKPDVPINPGIRGFGGRFGGMRGFCFPQTTTTN